MESSDKNREKNTNQEWNDPAFSWDEMQAGIFDKIIEEEPDFFAEKPRRRTVVWFWFGAAVLLIGGIGFWQFANLSGSQSGGEKENASEYSLPKPIEIQEVENLPIAKMPTDKNEIYFSGNNKEIKTTGIINSINSDIKNEPLYVNKNKEQLISGPSIFSNNSDGALVESVEKNNATEPVSKIKKTENKIRKTPNTLPINTSPLKWENTQPSFLFSIKKETESVDESALKGTEKNMGTEAKKRGQWAVSATGGSALSFSKYKGNSAAVDLRNDHTSSYFGYQYGVDISAPLSEKSRIFFGANRAVVYQNIDIETARQVDVLQENTVLHETHFVVGNRVEEVRGDTLVMGTERNRLVKYNEFKSVQAHAGYARDFGNENWNFSPFAGLAIGMVDHQEGYTVAEDKSIFSFDKNNRILNRFQLNTMAGVNVERKIGEAISLVFQYRFDKQWNNASAENGLKLRPASHYCSVGVAKRW